MRSAIVVGIGAAVIALALAGCSHDNATGPTLQAVQAGGAVPPMTAAQIAADENNPHVSPQMKAYLAAQSGAAKGSATTNQ